MSLVDDHKDEIKESDYIKICNAMKHLHNTVITNTQQSPPSTDPHTTVPQFTSPQAARLWMLNNERRHLDHQIHTIDRTRVTLSDKISALKRLLENHSIAIPSFNVRERDMVPVLEALVVGVMNTTDRNRMYQECKRERIARNLTRLRARRDVVIAEIQELS